MLRPSGIPSKRVDREFRFGFTLLELLVVLVILAIVSTIAVQSLQPQVDNRRYESAARLLAEIKSAALGPVQKYQVDGTPLVSGFVADVGRIPSLQATGIETEPTDSLAELWSSNCILGQEYPFQFRAGPTQPVDYSNVRIPCGWRGPYLQMPVGQNKLVDPWGRALELVADVGGEVIQVSIAPPPGTSETEPVPLTIDMMSGKVEVTGKVLLDNPENATVKAALLTPDPNSSLTTLAVVDDENEQPDSLSFRGVPIGLRAVVVDVDGARQTKYVQVTHRGGSVFFDFRKHETETTN